MIRHIKLIRNIGTFDSESPPASATFKRLSLVYADNARGKTTLTAILRSLASGNYLPIQERRRIGSDQPPHVVLDCDGSPSTVMYQDGNWNRVLPELKVFDDVFVNHNVYSGLDVDSQHRQNLHDLILGDQGVSLNRHLEESIKKVTEHTRLLNDKSSAIPEAVLGGLALDDFCNLPEIENLDEKIADSELASTIARNQETVQSTSDFTDVGLPEINISAIESVLSAELQDLNSAAETRVKEHMIKLGDEGESWLANGMVHFSQYDAETCPFCGQDIRELELIAHYQAYFSDQYQKLKGNIAELIIELGRNHGRGSQATFERAVSSAKEAAKLKPR